MMLRERFGIDCHHDVPGPVVDGTHNIVGVCLSGFEETVHRCPYSKNLLSLVTIVLPGWRPVISCGFSSCSVGVVGYCMLSYSEL